MQCFSAQLFPLNSLMEASVFRSGSISRYLQSSVIDIFLSFPCTYIKDGGTQPFIDQSTNSIMVSFMPLRHLFSRACHYLDITDALVLGDFLEAAQDSL